LGKYSGKKPRGRRENIELDLQQIFFKEGKWRELEIGGTVTQIP
jgi:hypothetical protein